MMFSACLTSTDWEQKSSMPTPRSEMAVVYLGGKIYVPGGLGGTLFFEVYDVVRDTWESLASLPAGRHHLMTVAHNGRIYVFGGDDDNWNMSASAWVYETATNQWKAIATMPEPRYAGAAVALGAYIYAAGGNGPSANLLRYDPTQGAWSILAPMRRRRDHNSTVVFQDKIVVIGGRYRNEGELNSVEVYDPKTNSWSDGPRLNTARAGHGTAVHDGKIIVMGGEVFTGGTKTLADSEILESLSGQWQRGPAMPGALHGVPLASTGDNLYILGGSERAGAVVNRGRVFRFSPAKSL